jgi:isoquinoline 1-oxidoreductase beta subunit
MWNAKKLRFGDLAADAAALTPPETPVYRAVSADPLYGQELMRLDLPSKVDGSANFAGDIRLPGMLYAAIRQGPHGDTRLAKTVKRKAMAVRGMVQIVTHERWVATVARNWWAANRALDRLAPEFVVTGTPASSDRIEQSLAAALKGGEGARIHSSGDVAGAFAGRKLVSAEYWVAPAQHAPIETRSATAEPTPRGVRIWVATQAPAQCRQAVAAALGLDTSDITLFPMMAGGSFGIALEHQVAIQAAIIARTIGKPVQLVWSRAEEIMRDLPRPPARARLTASLNVAGTIDALAIKIATPAAGHEIRARLLNGTRPHAARTDALGKSDASAVSGGIPPYVIPNFALDHLPADTGLPAGRWRGNGDSLTTFFTECFIDEMSAKAGIDPLSYRMAMLGGHPELARCLTTATMIGGWEGGIAGSGQGLACHSMRGSHIALMASARPSEGGLRVERLVAVVDSGRIVNPAVARQQIEGGLVFGLAAAVGATTDYLNGVATARRLGQLNLPKLAQCPEISVEFLESDRDPGGIGEIAVPVVGPAIANALFSATGRRIRRLPLTSESA